MENKNQEIELSKYDESVNEQNQSIKPNKKKKLNIYKILFFCIIPVLIISVVLNVLSVFEVRNEACSISAKVYGGSKVTTEKLKVGENYICDIDIENLNFTHVDKPYQLIIVIKKANVIKEIGGFKNISFDDFSYDTKNNLVKAEINISVEKFKKEKLSISFNFCPQAIGNEDLSISIYGNGYLLGSYTKEVELFS